MIARVLRCVPQFVPRDLVALQGTCEARDPLLRRRPQRHTSHTANQECKNYLTHGLFLSSLKMNP